MNPALIVFGLRSAIRLAEAGRSAYDQYARDRDVLFPAARAAEFDRIDFIRVAFGRKAEYEQLLIEPGELARYWDRDRPRAGVPNAADLLFARALEIEAASATHADRFDPIRAREIAGGVLIEQWAAEKGPIHPLAGLALTVADVALEFVAARPDLLGVGGRGEVLVRALATNLAAMVPDVPAGSVKAGFAQRLVAGVLRAGLATVAENANIVVSEKHLQELIARTLPPIVQALPETIADQVDFAAAVDALLGPAASAALQVLAAHQTAFGGDDFAVESAMGALVQALLRQASEDGLRGAVTEAGLLALLRSALTLAAERPHLFVGVNGTAEAAARDLFGKVAATLSAVEPPFNGDFGITLAGIVLDVLRNHAAPLLATDAPIGDLTAAVTIQVIEALQTGSAADRPLGRLLSREQLVEIVRTVLRIAASSPGMLGSDNTEAAAIIGAIAGAITADKQALLGPDDWREIARAAAEQVARDPARLLRLDIGDPRKQPVARLIQVMVAKGGEALAARGRAGGAILFGPTLRDAIIVLLKNAGGELTGETMRRLEAHLDALLECSKADPGRFASRAWLAAFEAGLGALFVPSEPGDLRPGIS